MGFVFGGLAREAPKHSAFTQEERVIVGDFRGQARSYIRSIANSTTPPFNRTGHTRKC